VLDAPAGRVPETGRDRSLEALQRQVTALGVARFEVGLREAKSGQMMNREWSLAELTAAAAWLSDERQGPDIYPPGGRTWAGAGRRHAGR
jgi:hypothetical protein